MIIIFYYQKFMLLFLCYLRDVLRKSQHEKRENWDSFWQVYIPMSILLLAAIGAKTIGLLGGLQVDKQALPDEQVRSVVWS